MKVKTRLGELELFLGSSRPEVLCLSERSSVIGIVRRGEVREVALAHLKLRWEE